MNTYLLAGLIVGFIAIWEVIYVLVLEKTTRESRKQDWWYYKMLCGCLASMTFLGLAFLFIVIRDLLKVVGGFTYWFEFSIAGILIAIFFSINKRVAHEMK